MKKIFTTIVLIVSLLPVVYGQASGCFTKKSGQVAFGPGEKLQYTASYSAAIISTDVADITFATTIESHRGVAAYKVTAHGRTRPFFNVFFEMDDIYTTWLDTTSMRPIKGVYTLKEGGYRYRGEFNFDWTKKIVQTYGNNIKSGATYVHKLQLGPCSFDAIGLFYNMRCIDMTNVYPQQQFPLSLVLEDTVRTIVVKFIGKTTKKIPGVGEFRALRFSCQFATSSDESFKNGAEFHIWITDDENKIPIYMESPIRVGRITVALARWSGLRHPFSSVVVK